MFATSLTLMLAAVPADTPIAAPATQSADYTGRFGCHPYSPSKAACVSRGERIRSDDTASESAQRCHPDPTKSRLCDAQTRRSAKSEQFAFAEKDGASNDQ